MSDQTSRILNQIFEDEKFIEVYTSCFENLEKKYSMKRKALST